MVLKNALKKRNQKRAHKATLAKPAQLSATKSAITIDDNFSNFLKNFRNLKTIVKASRTFHINSNSRKDQIKTIVKAYFSEIRPGLINGGIETQALDELAQILIKMVNSRAAVSLYKKIFDEMDSYLIDVEISRELSKSNLIAQSTPNNKTIISHQDDAIITTLEKFIPFAALSYKQVLIDIQLEKFSYRGTAAELREILREVLDQLAPDKDITTLPGFKPETDNGKPTMRQKVKFILKKRNKSDTAIESPEDAASIVDESIAKLARATYNRGSTSTHTQSEKQEIIQIKRYLDSVLCELLEIPT